MLRDFKTKLLNEKLKYKDKIIQQVREGKRGSSYSALKKLSLRPDQLCDGSFTLPNHVSANLSPSQSAEVIADYFSIVSQEFTPLSLNKLPPNVQSYMNQPQTGEIIPHLLDYDVFQRIRRAKKPKSSVGGDIPVKIVKNFGVEISLPV